MCEIFAACDAAYSTRTILSDIMHHFVSLLRKSWDLDGVHTPLYIYAKVFQTRTVTDIRQVLWHYTDSVPTR